MDEINSPTYKLNISPHLEKLPIEKKDWAKWLIKNLDISQPTAYRFINDGGLQIGLETLRRLSDSLDVPVQDLFVPVN